MTEAQTSTDEPSVALVLKDAAGSYYLVPQQTLERGRVPEEQRAEVERLLAEAAERGCGRGDEVHGYNLIVIGVGCIVVGLAMAHYGDWGQGEVYPPTWGEFFQPVHDAIKAGQPTGGRA